MKKRIVVVGAVVERNGDILCAQRSESMSLPGMWEFPGGKIEQNETPEQALARELVEELKCTVEVGQRLERTEYEYDFGVVDLTTYWATIIEGEPEPLEHAQLRWIPAAELNSVKWAPADIPAVDAIIETAVG